MELEMTPLKLFIMNGIDCRDAVEIADNGSLISFEGDIFLYFTKIIGKANRVIKAHIETFEVIVHSC